MIFHKQRFFSRRRSGRRGFVIAESLEPRALLAAAPVRLLQDLNPQNGSSDLSSIAPAQQSVYVLNEPDDDTQELFVTNGSEAVLVGRFDSAEQVRELTAFGNDLLFVTGRFNQPSTLWRADGTSGETNQLGVFDSVQSVTLFGEQVVFTADDGSTGRELWRSDGTAGGTGQVIDLASGEAGSSPEALTVVADELFFFRGDTLNNERLYKTDGTEDGTEEIHRLEGWRRNFNQAVVGDQLFFAARHDDFGTELWRSDGTSTGTYRVTENDADPSNLRALGDELVFTGFERGDIDELWKSDGTPAGTERIRRIEPASLSHFQSTDTHVFFSNRVNNSSAYEIWSTDGTDEGTIRLGEFNNFNWRTVTSTSSHFYFFDWDESRRLWRSDGTVEGTEMLSDFTGTAFPDNLLLTPQGQEVLFVGDDGTTGRELWRSDGTSDGTGLAVDLERTGSSSNPQGLYSIGNQQFVRALGRLYRVEPEGLLEIAAVRSERSGFIDVEEAGDFLLIRKYTGTDWELWRTDGTEGGSEFLAEFDPDFRGHAVVLNGRHYFRGSRGSLDSGHVYRTDGTPEGTEVAFTFRTNDQMIALEDRIIMVNESRWLYRWFEGDESPQTFFEFDDEPNIYGMRRVGNQMFFVTGNPVEGVGRELWVTDGSTNGTKVVRDLVPGNAGSDPTILGSHEGLVYFAATTDDYGREIWVTDGTEEGTRLFADVAAGTESSSPSFVTVFNDEVFFAADDQIHGRELWKTNGTTEGLRLVADINPGERSAFPQQNNVYLSVVDGRLLFPGFDSEFGTELWTTDGTTEGTNRVTDISPGAGSAWPVVLGTVDSSVVLSAWTVETGREPWILELDVSEEETQLDAKLVGSTLRFNGGPSDETISVAERGDTIVITVDGASRSFPSDQVSRVHVTTGAGDDSITVDVTQPALIKGGKGEDTILGGRGNDTLIGGGGDDLIQGRAGDDSIHGSQGADILSGNDGRDTVRGGGGEDTVNGGADGDRLFGGPGKDVLSGGTGDDSLNGGPQEDLLNGGEGDDALRGGRGRDTLAGGFGDDLLLGGGGKDSLLGESGRDLIVGGAGRDALYGGEGDDLLIGGGSIWSALRLAEVRVEWSSSRSYEDRADNIRGEGGNRDRENGRVYLTPRTVFDRNKDELVGGDDRDWFFVSLIRDKLSDKQFDELVTRT